MKRTAAIAIIVIVVIGAVIGILVANRHKSDNKAASSSSSATSSPTSNTSTNTPATSQNAVSISNFSFSPSSITVKKGTKVTWTNKDSTSHTVTPDKPDADFKGSDTLSNGDSYSVTFNTVGTFTYHCNIHSNMTGSVKVTE
ncbi:MAG: plastocyanin [Candidatus Saccharibacteria bacterium]|nr:plastocyanin [Candidatus Saccharibacteria bacterium]